VPAAQPVSQPQFHGGVEGIRVEVLAADGDRVLSDLAASDFVVTDNGVRQAVARLTTAGSVSLALVLDASDSMSSAAGLAHLRTATAAVERALGAGDLVSVVTAADRVRLWADRLPGAERLSSVLGLAQPVRNSFTALWDAVLAGNSLVADAPGRAAVLVVSDGADNASWFSRAPAINRLKRRGTPVDGIHVPWVERDAVDIAYGDINLREPALATGGVHFGVTDPALGKKLSDRFAALRQSYLLFYTPTNVRPQKDGWHEIKVSLRPGVKGKVQARPGYYAPVKK
jgi:VWFA-related protein